MLVDRSTYLVITEVDFDAGSTFDVKLFCLERILRKFFSFITKFNEFNFFNLEHLVFTLVIF